MNPLSGRVAARFADRKDEIPVWSPKHKRIVYVLPETQRAEPSKYEKIPEDEDNHVKNHGHPGKPKKPRHPHRPHKPTIPRDLTPAPVRPPQPPKPVKPVPLLKPLPEIKPPKVPEPPKHPREWKVDKPPVYYPKDAASRVMRRYQER